MGWGGVSYNPVPGTDISTSGAPTSEQSRGELSERLRIQLKEELEDKCSRIANRLDRIHRHFYLSPTYKSHTHHALLEYLDLAFEYVPFDEKNIRSIQRVISACKRADFEELVDYVPELEEIIEELAGSKEREIAKLGKRLREMTYAELISEAEEVIDKLLEYEYYDDAQAFAEYIDSMSFLYNVLRREIIRMAMKYGDSREEAEGTVRCLVKC